MSIPRYAVSKGRVRQIGRLFALKPVRAGRGVPCPRLCVGMLKMPSGMATPSSGHGTQKLIGCADTNKSCPRLGAQRPDAAANAHHPFAGNPYEDERLATLPEP